MKNCFLRLIVVFACLSFFQKTILSQEMPIATGPENTISGGGAFDGTNFMVSIINIVNGQYNIELQIMGPGGTLVGDRISTGKIGSGCYLAFDGTNYLLTFTDPFPFFANGETNGIGTLYGQMVSKTGGLIGNTFTIAENVNLKYGQGRGTLSYNGSSYFITYCKGGNHTDIIYGQRISTAGSLIESPVQITSNYAREQAICFNGTNYLLAYCEGSGPDGYIYGQFINSSGQLIGTNFLIDGTPDKSDNPLAMDYDGEKFIVLFHDQAADGQRWNIFARPVTGTGEVYDRGLIVDSSKTPMGPKVEFDGTNHLVTWMKSTPPMTVNGRFFNNNGQPVGDDFILFDTLGGKFAMGGVAGYKDGTFLIGGMRSDSQFSDADIYMKFIKSLTGVTDDNNKVSDYILYQNYPNPFNPGTVIKYALPSESRVQISVYNLLGQKVRTLLDKSETAGNHEIYFDASGLAGGIYFYSITAGTFSSVQKMIYLK